MTLAHFTAQDLPGTLAILAAGVAIGIAVSTRDRLGAARWVCFAALAILTVVAAGADYDPLFVSIAAAAGGKIVIDVVWLAVGVVTVALGIIGIKSERRRESADSR